MVEWLVSGHKPLCYATAVQHHARIVKSGYATHPSLLLVSVLCTYAAHSHTLKLVSQFVDDVLFPSFDLVTANQIITRLMQMGQFPIANMVFDKMPQRDVVTWNSAISGCVRNGHSRRALKLFRELLSSSGGVQPDAFTFSSTISACARMGSIAQAKWVHAVMRQNGVGLNFILSSALIDMYSKCGNLKAAKEVFGSVQRRDVCVWNAMIHGLAIHGDASDAITVFSRMELENVSPDAITFVGILTACGHCGLVDQGRDIFNAMARRYGVRPQLEHYGAMVNLFARAGLLGDAYSVVKEMPMEADVVIWRTILSACRNLKSPELGRLAIDKISGLRRSGCGGGGDHVLLSNMYCSMSNWDRAQEVRELMRSKRVGKVKGKSWVEVAGVLHHFKSGDRSHPETKSIYGVLEGLTRRVNLEGFTPVMEFVLMDVMEEEKDGNLRCHSEKLALAYGILKSSPGTLIMIMQNLRTCCDCHSWMKVVSRVLGRVILVRDRIRFHRFEDGGCSCADYW